LAKLTKEEVVTIRVLKQQRQSHCQTARTLGVSEGTVRYHLRRAAAGAADGRKKQMLLERSGLSSVVKEWWEEQQQLLNNKRPPSVEALHEFLCCEYDYRGSYKSVRKYVRELFPASKVRPFRRVETPPGAQSQSDWFDVRIDIGDAEGPVKLYGFLMVLSHSRKAVVIWSRSMDQLAWHRCHNEAYKRLGGVAAVNRIDNLKTGIQSGVGAGGEINAQYRTYARSMRFHIDACEGAAPEQKGKVERRVRVIRSLDVAGRCFNSLEHLQEWTDAKLAAVSKRRICPATGKSVAESWEAERTRLIPLPANLPEPFDLVRTCPVHKDCSIRFEGRTYIVPFKYVGQQVEVRGCAGFIQVADRRSGEIVVRYPRGTSERILIDQRCFAGAGTERVEAPKPLGKMARKLQEIMETPVQQRPLDLYAALAEVAR
jgi:transposase